ncbi:MAG TPA: MG2 domain-containing protein [Kofleriaceae bacterium]|jgi:hypothetical protein
MKRFLAIAAVVGAAALIGLCNTGDGTCESAYLKYGVSIGACPSGTVRQTAELVVNDLRRGAKGTVRLLPHAHYTVNDSDAAQTIDDVRVTTATLALVDAKGTATPLPVKWTGNVTELTLPEVPDGDYLLRATYETRVAKGTLDVKIPLYTPARIHVVTDRPLYEPGNSVKFRAVALRARDLAPLDGRPGHWVVTDPDGEVLLEEAAPAGDWGVVAGSFPIDKQARTGMWKIAWVSDQARDEIEFKVEPFKLPRFRVDVAADKTFYRAGDKPKLTGAVVYSSGAPVPNAKLEIEWSVDGGWPPPTEWIEKLLPKTAQTEANGHFELAIPVVPQDLQGVATLSARISAVDPAGDRVEGSASALLSADGIAATYVTELADGLVEGFNNRMYVRVTTPDGEVVRNTKILVKRAWDRADKGTETAVDEDGVASLQLDPGAAVNVVIPAVPYRPTPRAALVSRGDIEDLLGEGASLADQVEMDKWLAPLGACGKWVGSDESDGGGEAASIGLRIDKGGAVVAVGANPTALGRCSADILRGKHLPGGKDRLYRVQFTFTDPELPALHASLVSALSEDPDGLQDEINMLSASARDCLPRITQDMSVPKALAWHVGKGDKEVSLGGWVDSQGDAAASAAMGCISAKFGSKIKFETGAPADAIGLITFTMTPPASVVSERPQPTVQLGYELVVTAPGLPGAPTTKMIVNPGTVPDLRLRVNPILAKAGDTVTAELIRGPNYTGELPKELIAKHLKGEAKVKVGEDHKAAIVIDPKAEGWVEISGAGQRALVFVKPERDLVVSVDPEKPRYAPGDQAQLDVVTKISGKGAKAAVGLFGVDQSLGQLVTLDKPDSMGRLQPQVTTSAPAFGTLDGQALTLGRIRGANAAAATVLRVSAIPAPPELDATVSTQAATHFDPVEELTDNFYTVLTELHTQTRDWEKSAAQGVKMQPAVMAQLWKQAIAACKARGEKVVDAYGRELRLSMLPQDLLSLTDPRAVVINATHLSEDVENWAAWVAKERP